ncbi:MAG: hypothetical protein GY705_21520 [Bacteroidetes bacterium]|nr:hypothetical protein [Bacteroidota bacterium]
MNLLHRFVRWCPGALGFVLRQKYYRRLFGYCGKKVIFGRFLNLQSPEKISIGDHVILNNFVTLDAGNGTSQSCHIEIEPRVFIGSYSSLIVENGGTIVLKEGTNISSCCFLQSDNILDIGRDCLFAAYCHFGLVEEENKRKMGRPVPITKVGDACWIGVRVQQYAGTEIGKESIVGAHALVKSDIPAFSIAVGQPANVQRKRCTGVKKS